LYFLNSKVNYRAEDNFNVTFDKRVLDLLKTKGITSKEDFVNRTVRVTGKITIYLNKPQIVVDSPDQIQIVNR
jgi:DNA/RNA endonuclease YhcR with UshA esterase domain